MQELWPLRLMEGGESLVPDSLNFPLGSVSHMYRESSHTHDLLHGNHHGLNNNA